MSGKDSNYASIDAASCVKCGACLGECPFGAIEEDWLE